MVIRVLIKYKSDGFYANKGNAEKVKTNSISVSLKVTKCKSTLIQAQHNTEKIYANVVE